MDEATEITGNNFLNVNRTITINETDKFAGINIQNAKHSDHVFHCASSKTLFRVKNRTFRTPSAHPER